LKALKRIEQWFGIVVDVRIDEMIEGERVDIYVEVGLW
jgi:hypothetical protein